MSNGGGGEHEGGARPHPPLIYLAFLVLGLVVNMFYPLPFWPTGNLVLLLVGLGIVMGGLAIGGGGLRAMMRAGVSPLPWKAPGRLVTEGPFRYSRNPLYVSLALIYLGISVTVNTIWPLASLVFALVIVDRGVIRQEERFLEKRFGEEYQSYKLKVRRWM